MVYKFFKILILLKKINIISLCKEMNEKYLNLIIFEGKDDC